jgi:hypothetical protein
MSLPWLLTKMCMSNDNKEELQDEELQEDVNIEQDEDLSEHDDSEELELDSEEESKDKDEEEVDYKSMYDEAQGKMAKQNERIEKQDKKIVKLKKKQREDDDSDDSEQEDLDDVDEKLDRKLQEKMITLREDIIDDAIEEVSSNEDEKKLIRFYFENSLKLEGFSKREIREAVGFAKAIANRKKSAVKAKLISKKLNSDKTAGSRSHAGQPPSAKLKYTQEDKRMADKWYKGDVKKWLKYKSN